MFLSVLAHPGSPGQMAVKWWCGDCNVAVAEWLALPSALWEDQSSNLTMDGCVYRECHCDVQSWARAAHIYCSA